MKTSFSGRKRLAPASSTHANTNAAARRNCSAAWPCEIDLDAPCRRLTTAQQQLVEIAKALAFDARILVMDEPSAALTSHEVARLFEIIRDLKARGIGIIYIGHRLDEIFAIADRVTVLRDGTNVGDRPIGGVTRNELIELMVGRELDSEFPSRDVTIGPARLEVAGLQRASAVRNVSFAVRRGEILALTGLVGAGRTETVRLIFGADQRDAGEIRLDGKLLTIRTPRDAIAAGIGLLTEDRKLEGLVLGHSVRENFGLPNLDWLAATASSASYAASARNSAAMSSGSKSSWPARNSVPARSLGATSKR